MMEPQRALDQTKGWKPGPSPTFFLWFACFRLGIDWSGGMMITLDHSTLDDHKLKKPKHEFSPLI